MKKNIKKNPFSFLFEENKKKGEMASLIKIMFTGAVTKVFIVSSVHFQKIWNGNNIPATLEKKNNNNKNPKRISKISKVFYLYIPRQ